MDDRSCNTPGEMRPGHSCSDTLLANH